MEAYSHCCAYPVLPYQLNIQTLYFNIYGDCADQYNVLTSVCVRPVTVQSCSGLHLEEVLKIWICTCLHYNDDEGGCNAVMSLEPKTSKFGISLKRRIQHTRRWWS